MKKTKGRQGFSLVELIVVIIIIAILAVTAFAGGSAAIKKANVSRTTSDMHSFAIAIESFMNSTPAIANAANTTNFSTFIAKLNESLDSTFQIDATPVTASTTSVADSGGNIAVKADNLGNHAVIYQSKKTDAWGNYYYVIFDAADRHGTSNSDFYIYVISAGPDAKTELAGAIGGGVADGKEDDIFLLAQYENGEVSSATYNMSDVSILLIGTASGYEKMADITKAEYCAPEAGTDLYTTLPVNF